MSLRPFDPTRERKGLFLIERDAEAAPLLTLREVQFIKQSEGMQGIELDAFWRELWSRHDLNLDDLFPVIVGAAWRITRGLAVAKGRLQPDGYLNEMDFSEWSTPSHGINTTKGTRSLERALVTRSVALCPPAAPAEWSNGEKDPAYYDASADEELCEYLTLVETVSRRLGIDQTKEGRYGLVPLLDPTLTRAAWPSPREIMAYESIMVDGAVQTLIAEGHFGALRKLREQGLSQDEATTMILLARRAMRSMRGGTDSDGDKATMIARLEDLASRCRTSLDLRAELMVYKTLAVVQGITKTQGTDDDLEDMVDVAGEVIAGELTEGEDDIEETD